VEPASNPEELMARYQAGDFAAAGRLIRQLSPQLRRFFAVEWASRAHADDLLQETWLRIHRVRQTYRPGEPLLPWLYAIARYVRVDHYRKMSRTVARERPLDEESAAAHPETGDGGAEELEALLAPLTSGEREVIEMMKIAGMSLEEVARALSLSVGAVKQKVHRAYESLRRLRGGMR
jgi:RNA polymerase sigma-70 factor (ECF subfamily)